MATINYAQEQIKGFGEEASVITWPALATGDDGKVVQNTSYKDRSVQVSGTFGGATCTIQGSNDGVNWFTLNDPQGNALTFTSARIEQILEVTRYIRPAVTGGTAVSINIIMVVVRG